MESLVCSGYPRLWQYDSYSIVNANAIKLNFKIIANDLTTQFPGASETFLILGLQIPIQKAGAGRVEIEIVMLYDTGTDIIIIYIVCIFLSIQNIYIHTFLFLFKFLLCFTFQAVLSQWNVTPHPINQYS